MNQSRWFRIGKCVVLGCLAASVVLPQLTWADDAPPRRPGAGARRGGGDAGAFLKTAREKVDELNLTAEQKPKVDEIFTNAETDLKRTFADAQSLSPEDRRQKFTEFLSGLKEKVAAVLTDEQKAKFEPMQLTGPSAGAGGRRGAAGGRGAVGERLKEILDKLELNDEQKEKVKKVMEEENAKMEEIRAAAQSGDREKVREKAMAAMKEIREKVMPILTPEQQKKFQELSAAAGAGPGARPGAGRRRPGAGETPKPESTETKPETKPESKPETK